ncbi:MAG: ADP-ribosylglycohydrolase family protein [Bryobacterales bacterium]|nr:ADP-ribosylglycohydrolase family protein [Bryobacterales bacterium]
MPAAYKQQLRTAIRAAQLAGSYLRDCFHDPSIKGHTCDTAAERTILEVLGQAYPEYGYHGEELGLVRQPQDAERHLWLVDPNDGTSACEAGFRGAAVSIALLRDGLPVLGVVYAYCAPDDDGDLFTWAEGLSLYRNGLPVDTANAPATVLLSLRAEKDPLGNTELVGPYRFRAVPGIAYRLALVAAGEAQAAISLNGPLGYRLAGGHALLRGAGMAFVDSLGRPIDYTADGDSSCVDMCFGGPIAVAQDLRTRDWQQVLRWSNRPEDAYGLCWPERGQAVRDSSMLARAQGCWLGQLAGDALGSLVEFQHGHEIAQRYPEGVSHLADGGTWNTLAGQPTDDSELALMLARSMLATGGYSDEAAAEAYAYWFGSPPFDVGNATRKALGAAARAHGKTSKAAAARQAADSYTQANGALMRSSPLGIVAAAAGEQGVEWAIEDSRLTHPNPVCAAANEVFVDAIGFAIASGATAAEVYARALERTQRPGFPESVAQAVKTAAGARPVDYHSQMGWVLIALQNAFWQLLHAPGLAQGVSDTVMAGGDTDTNAAIAGALLGAVYGRESVPLQWRDRILTCRPVHGLPGVAKPRPEAFWPVDALWLAEQLLWPGRG